MVSLRIVQDVLLDRPRKLTAEQVEYEAAPEGSVLRCNSCLHFFRRAIDGFAVCEIMRDKETDENGVRPDYRCRFWTVDGDVHPFLPEEEPPVPEEDIPY